MSLNLFPNPWLINALLDDGFIAQKRSELAAKPPLYDLSSWLDNHFKADLGRVSVRETSNLRILLALAWFNTVPVDWLARFMIQMHANKTYLFRLPTPQPSDAEIRANPDYALLAKNALVLTLAASWDDFAELAPLFSIKRDDVPTTKKALDGLRAENDKIVARLYGITDLEFTHLLKSFPGMANKRPEYMALLH